MRLFQMIVVIGVLCAGALMPPFSMAQDERATVRLDGRTVLRLGPNEELDAVTRANRVEQRLFTLLENPDSIAPAIIEFSGDERIIAVSGVPIVTVTETDAEDNVTTLDALATQWAQVIDTQLQRGRERRQTTGWQVQLTVESAFAQIIESITSILPRILAAVLIIVFFWGAAALVRWLMRELFKYFIKDRTVENLIRQLVYYTIWLLGVLVAVNAMGFDPQTVATGIGLTSLALGFALQDILSNFVSGILILLLRPFELGDQIIVGTTEGSVERIALRAMRIRAYDGRIILVPNAELFTSRVTNNTASPVRRASVDVHLSYDADLNTALRVIKETVQATQGVLPQPAVVLLVQELGQADICIEVRFWADSTRMDFLETMSEANRRILEALKMAGVSLPDPAMRSVILRDASPDDNSVR